MPQQAESSLFVGGSPTPPQDASAVRLPRQDARPILGPPSGFDTRRRAPKADDLQGPAAEYTPPNPPLSAAQVSARQKSARCVVT